eukprot:6206480-Pleurochrysis_carterae.AAC.1
MLLCTTLAGVRPSPPGRAHECMLLCQHRAARDHKAQLMVFVTTISRNLRILYTQFTRVIKV